MLDRVSGKGAPVATVFVAGRPLYVNKELNRSDAFVAAWLPGTEGDGVADLLVKGPKTGKGYTGKLSYSWPASAVPDAAERRRRGLRAAVQARLRPAPTARRRPCRSCRRSRSRAASTAAAAVRRPRISSCSSARTSTRTRAHRLTGQLGRHRARQQPERPGGGAHEHRGALADVNVQQDARKITWKGGAGQFYIQSQEAGPAAVAQRRRRDRLGHDHHEGAHGQRTVISAHCTYPCFSDAPITKVLADRADGAKHTIKIPRPASTTGRSSSTTSTRRS